MLVLRSSVTSKKSVIFKLHSTVILILKPNNFAKSFTPIQDKFIETILHSYKALLFDRNDIWIKKDNPEFDETLGSYDGAEVWESVGIYILDIFTKDFGYDKLVYTEMMG